MTEYEHPEQKLGQITVVWRPQLNRHFGLDMNMAEMSIM